MQLDKRFDRGLPKGDFALVRVMGEPGSEVFQARARDGRDVVLRFWHSENELDMRSAIEIASNACGVRHPMLASVFGVREHADGTLSLVSEYVPGRTLDGWVAEAGLPPLRMAVDFVRRLALGLHAAHQRGLSHHAFYPGNIVVVEPDTKPSGRIVAKLLDLGVPRSMRPAVRFEAAHFMAPEALVSELSAARPLAANVSLNVYSCGCLLHYLCTGQPPFQSDSLEGLSAVHAAGPVATPSRINPDIPENLERVIAHALEREPQRRVSSAAALAASLSSVESVWRNSWVRRKSPPPPPPAANPGRAPRVPPFDLVLVPVVEVRPEAPAEVNARVSMKEVPVRAERAPAPVKPEAPSSEGMVAGSSASASVNHGAESAAAVPAAKQPASLVTQAAAPVSPAAEPVIAVPAAKQPASLVTQAAAPVSPAVASRTLKRERVSRRAVPAKHPTLVMKAVRFGLELEQPAPAEPKSAPKPEVEAVRLTAATANHSAEAVHAVAPLAHGAAGASKEREAATLPRVNPVVARVPVAHAKRARAAGWPFATLVGGAASPAAERSAGARAIQGESSAPGRETSNASESRCSDDSTTFERERGATSRKHGRVPSKFGTPNAASAVARRETDAAASGHTISASFPKVPGRDAPSCFGAATESRLKPREAAMPPPSASELRRMAAVAAGPAPLPIGALPFRDTLPFGHARWAGDARKTAETAVSEAGAATARPARQITEKLPSLRARLAAASERDRESTARVAAALATLEPIESGRPPASEMVTDVGAVRGDAIGGEVVPAQARDVRQDVAASAAELGSRGAPEENLPDVQVAVGSNGAPEAENVLDVAPLAPLAPESSSAPEAENASGVEKVALGSGSTSEVTTASDVDSYVAIASNPETLSGVNATVRERPSSPDVRRTWFGAPPLDSTGAVTAGTDGVDALAQAACAEAASSETASAEAASAEVASMEADSAEASSAEASSAEASSAEASSAEAASAEAASAEAASTEAASTEASSAEAASTAVASTEASSAEASPTEAPSAEASSAEASSTAVASTAVASTEASSTEASSTEASSAEVASTAVASTAVSSTEASSTEASSTEASSAEASSTEASSTEASSTEASSTEASSTEAASMEVASTEVASTEVASTGVPSTEAASPTPGSRSVPPARGFARIRRRLDADDVAMLLLGVTERNSLTPYEVLQRDSSASPRENVVQHSLLPRERTYRRWPWVAAVGAGLGAYVSLLALVGAPSPRTAASRPPHEESSADAIRAEGQVFPITSESQPALDALPESAAVELEPLIVSPPSAVEHDVARTDASPPAPANTPVTANADRSKVRHSDRLLDTMRISRDKPAELPRPVVDPVVASVPSPLTPSSSREPAEAAPQAVAVGEGWATPRVVNAVELRPSARPARVAQPPAAVVDLPPPAALRTEKLDVRGSLSDANVRRATDRIRPQLTGCFAQHAPASSADSIARVELTIDETGRVRDTRVRGASSPLEACLAQASRKVVSGAPDTGTVKVAWNLRYGR